VSGYLARLALRAAGRPAGARLTPRIDARGEFARAADAVDAIGGELVTGVSVPLPGESDDRTAANREPMTASSPRAPIAVLPRGRAASAPVASKPQRSAQSQSAVRTPAAATPFDVPGAVDAIDRLGPTASRAPQLGAPTVARAGARPHTGPEAAPEAGAAHTRRGRASSPERPHDRGTQALDRPRPEAGEWPAIVPAPALREQRVPMDRTASRSLQQSEARGEAQWAADTNAVRVEIGRIDVRVAPPPAPASRPRAAPEGFAGYWRLRNYLDRP
jgi:hypothetical protein